MLQPELYTIEDFNTKKAEDLFTDREEPRKAFWDVYDAMIPGSVSAIGFYGVGGIGKSTLVKKIGEEIDERVEESNGLDHMSYNFEEYTTKEALLFRLSREMCLRIKGLSFPIFDAAISKICSEGTRDFEKIKEETAKSLIENPIVDVALSIVGEFVPGVGSAAKVIDGIVSLNNKVKHQKEESGREANLYKLINGLDCKTLVNEYLHQFFVYDVGKHMIKRTRPFVIFLDGYERYIDDLSEGELSVGKDNWIHANFRRLVEIPNTLWVVAGREKIKWKEDIMPKENLHLMGNLSDKDAIQYFAKAGITDHRLCEQLYELSHGTPVYMDICVRTYEEIIKKNCRPDIECFGKDTSELAQRYLRYMDKPTRRLMELISWLPSVWTVKMVENIANKVEYNSYLPELSVILKLSLVEAEGARYKLHETCRVVARSVCENIEKIQKAVLEFIKDEIFNDESEEEQWSMLSWLFEILEVTNQFVFSDEELSEFLDELEYIREYEGDYHKNAILSKKIYDYFMKNPCSHIIRVRCACVYIYDLLEMGQYQSAQDLATSIYEYAMEYLPKESNVTLRAMSMYSMVFYYNGEYQKAKDIMEQCYEIRKRVLGEEDPDTLYCLNNLAIDYSQLGDYHTAKRLNEECYEISKRVLGEEDPDTLYSLNNLAIVYSQLEDYLTAKELAEQCYKIEKQVFGEEHPRTLGALNNLVARYSELGDHVTAKELAEQCYEIQKNVLGEEHPSTLGALINLVLEYSALGEHLTAKKLGEQCYELQKQTLGEEHPNTLISLYNLATEYRELEEYEEALELFERCYEIQKRVLGEEHPSTINSLQNLIIEYSEFEEYETAKELCEQCYEIQKRIWGEEDPDTLNILNYLALQYGELEEYETAKELMEQCYEIRKRVLGEEDPDTLASLNNLAIQYRELGEHQIAKELMEQCYESMKNILGEEHPNTLASMNNLAEEYREMGDEIKEKELREKYAEIQKHIFD
ncbi:MAG: ATP-binding protein [Lachnospiraceae bacterium]|nr:ATP-binding protein [Lachnospiraceae bacterium]